MPLHLVRCHRCGQIAHIHPTAQAWCSCGGLKPPTPMTPQTEENEK